MTEGFFFLCRGGACSYRKNNGRMHFLAKMCFGTAFAGKRTRLSLASEPNSRHSLEDKLNLFVRARPAGCIFLRKCASARLLLVSRQRLSLASEPNSRHSLEDRTNTPSEPTNKKDSTKTVLSFCWRARQDSNLRPTGS